MSFDVSCNCCSGHEYFGSGVRVAFYLPTFPTGKHSVTLLFMMVLMKIDLYL